MVIKAALNTIPDFILMPDVAIRIDFVLNGQLVCGFDRLSRRMADSILGRAIMIHANTALVESYHSGYSWGSMMILSIVL